MIDLYGNLYKTTTVGDVIAANIEELKNKHETRKPILGMETGLVDFDYIADGIHRGEVTVIGGRPAMGKTVFALNIASNMAKNNAYSVAYLSLAQSPRVIGKKLLAMTAIVPIDKLTRGDLAEDDWQRINRAYNESNKMSLNIIRAVGISVKDIEILCMENENLDVIFIDYLQLMLHEYYPCESEIESGCLVNELKNISKNYNVAIILLSQILPMLEDREDKRPKVGDFMDLNIKSDFDNVIGIYRDEYYDRFTNDKGIMEIHMLVNKHKPTGTCLTAFAPEYCKVSNLGN